MLIKSHASRALRARSRALTPYGQSVRFGSAAKTHGPQEW